jgi:hypothetical protein
MLATFYRMTPIVGTLVVIITIELKMIASSGGNTIIDSTNRTIITANSSMDTS